MNTAFQRVHGGRMSPKRAIYHVQCAATAPHERYARAAAKYRTGPTHMPLYTRPNLLAGEVEEFDLAEQVSKFTAAAASNPHLYALKLADERNKVEEESRRGVSWADIL